MPTKAIPRRVRMANVMTKRINRAKHLVLCGVMASALTRSNPDPFVVPKQTVKRKSRSFCGAKANCKAYKACSSDETCQEGQCISTACPVNHHDYQDRCEPDSLNHCGEHNNRCATQIDGWVNGECSNGQCSATQCMDSFHLYMNNCERDSVEHCGEHDLDCRNIMPGFSDGYCIDKTCVATKCLQDYHLYHNACEPDDETHCGQHTTDCHNLLGYNTGVCVDSACKILTCVVGYHLDSTNNRCVEDKTYKVGDIILFGSYYQSNATTKEPIQWRVLEIDSVNHKILLLSEYVLDTKPYHISSTYESVTWLICTLRDWLNNDFMNTAFSETEHAKILTTHLETNYFGTVGIGYI